MASPAPQPKPVPNGKPPPQGAQGAPAAKPSRLQGIKRGQLRSALRHLFYGVEGVGKSSLAADAPSPLFLDVEGGADNLDVARYPFRDEPGGHVPRQYEEVIGAVEDLIANPGHGYQTLVIDTVDALESLIHRYLCAQHGKNGIEDFGFGKGYKASVEELRRFLARLDALRMTGVQIVSIGHSFVSTFKNPEGEDYDRYQLHVHKDFGGQLKEWSDVVGFIRFEGGAAKLTGDESKNKRARGWTTNRRLIQLAREAAWDAKCRLSLPAEIELGTESPWKPFAEAKEVARDADRDAVVASIIAEIDRITHGDRGIFMTAAGRNTSFNEINHLIGSADSAALARILAGLKSTNPVTPTAVSKES